MVTALQFGFMGLPRSIAETVALAREAEEAGCTWLGVADSPTVYQESYLHQAEALRATSRLRVGPMASHVVLRHPLIVANLLATLSETFGERVIGTVATGNSGARGLGLPPATVDELEQAIQAIRGYFAGRGGAFGSSSIPSTGIERASPPVTIAADGPRGAQLAGRVADGFLYGGSMNADVLARRAAAGRTRAEQMLWAGPSVSLADTVEGVLEDMGAMAVAMANRAFRGGLAERGVPPVLHDDVRTMWQRYDYAFHADSSRPRNLELVTDRLADHLVRNFVIWGDEDQWRAQLETLAAHGFDGVMLILGQGEQLDVARKTTARLRRLGYLPS